MTTVYFTTNRRPDREVGPTGFGKDFNRDGMASLRFGSAEVKGRTIKLSVAPEKLELADNGRALDPDKSKLGSLAVFEGLRKVMSTGHPDTVLFVHGYNVSFRDALYAAAETKQRIEAVAGAPKVNMALFSWPSDGSMAPWLAYASDRRDAAASGPALARALLKFDDYLRKLPSEQMCRGRVHLLAHSMGNYVLRHAVQEFIRQRDTRLPRLFDQVLLMAADEDDDAFELDHKLRELPKLCRRVNVYFNREDRAMSISDMTKGNPPRLGDEGPRLPFQVPAKVTQVDCTPVVSGAIEHSYYKDADAVVMDLCHVLRGAEPQDVPGRRFVDDRNKFVIGG